MRLLRNLGRRKLRSTLTITGVLMLIMIVLLGGLGAWLGLTWPWFLAVLFTAVLFVRQIASIRCRDREACFRAFLNNNWVGMALFVGLLGHFAVSGAYSGI